MSVRCFSKKKEKSASLKKMNGRNDVRRGRKLCERELFSILNRSLRTRTEGRCDLKDLFV